MMQHALSKILMIAPVAFLAGCGQGEISFADDVQPIFDKNCVRCHGEAGEGVEVSDFQMVDYNSVMKGTALGQVVVPGSRMSSALYLVVAGKTAPEIRMPPHNDESFAEGRGTMLSARMIETIGLWIDQGAKNN